MQIYHISSWLIRLTNDNLRLLYLYHLLQSTFIPLPKSKTISDDFTIKIQFILQQYGPIVEERDRQKVHLSPFNIKTGIYTFYVDASFYHS
jgi:hypothetical protein